MKTKRKILITSALPYANGMLHLGHMLEVIQADIFARFQKLIANDCLYVCADDAHGTPIMLKAMELNISPEELIKKFHKAHIEDFKNFLIEFDQFHSTHSEENRQLSEMIFNRLNKKGLIEEKEVEGAFDQKKQMFLPDRFVKGTCPKCRAENQNGDNCEVCGSTYNPKDLIDPKSILSDSPVILKKSNHLFFKLSTLDDFLSDFIKKTPLQKGIKNKLQEWFKQGIKDWDISRDAPYFGFSIPNHPDKYFYVWLDAPIGYIASYKKYCEKKGINFLDFWGDEYHKNTHSSIKSELYHFIGKDIVYFHALFWPAILNFAHFRVPNNIFVHGFLTINGEKMSKSGGTFILARDYLKCLEPEYLRYYFASKLNNRVEDIDLNLEDLKTRINSDLVGKLINIASRSANLLERNFDNILTNEINDKTSLNLMSLIKASSTEIENYYESRQYSKVVKCVIHLADKTNQYFNDKKPWQMLKQDESESVHQVLSLTLNAFLLLIIYLKPIMPSLAKKVEIFFNINPLTWMDINKLLLSHQINSFTPLLSRIEDEKINELLEISA